MGIKTVIVDLYHYGCDPLVSLQFRTVEYDDLLDYIENGFKSRNGSIWLHSIGLSIITIKSGYYRGSELLVKAYLKD